jgi:hypothetical protein
MRVRPRTIGRAGSPDEEAVALDVQDVRQCGADKEDPPIEGQGDGQAEGGNEPCLDPWSRAATAAQAMAMATFSLTGAVPHRLNRQPGGEAVVEQEAREV